jgi:hypothetical protein
MPTIPFDKTQLYYAIIGCGFSAITNHAILQQTGDRIEGYTVLHIGFRDPWAVYYPMPMGQWPSLLTLPGYQTKLPNVTASTCLGSDEFSLVNQAEWDRLLSVRPFTHVQATVTAIQIVGTPPTEYRLILDDDPSRFVRAAYVDVCGGPGPAKDLPATVTIDPNLVAEYQTGTHFFTPWPRLVTGERYLTASSAEPTNGAVCIVGGGPTAAWCVEHAQSQGNDILWLSNDSLNPAFVSSRRNDSLVSGVIRRPLVNGEHVVDGLLKPRKLTTIFAEGFEPTNIDVLPDDRVRVHFQPVAGKKFRYVNMHGRQAFPTYRDFDQVIYSIGQITDPKNPKSLASLVASVLKSAISRKNHLILDRNHRAVGLQSEDQRVRVLGAAALSHPDLEPQWSTPGTRSNLLFRSLTEQARVRVGITLAALTIAEANRLWNPSTNENVNTAGLGDLKVLLARLDPALDAPQTWFESRGVRIPPFTHSEFGSLMTRKFNY